MGGRGRQTDDVGLHVCIRIRPSLGIPRWTGPQGFTIISRSEFTQRWSQLIKEGWGSHMTGASIYLSLQSPFSSSSSQDASSSKAHFFCVLVVAPLLTEPWGWFRRRIGALSPEEEAAVSEFPLVPWTCLPWNADIQQHDYIWGGETWTFFFLFSFCSHPVLWFKVQKNAM